MPMLYYSSINRTDIFTDSSGKKYFANYLVNGNRSPYGWVLYSKNASARVLGLGIDIPYRLSDILRKAGA